MRQLLLPEVGLSYRPQPMPQSIETKETPCPGFGHCQALSTATNLTEIHTIPWGVSIHLPCPTKGPLSEATAHTPFLGFEFTV